MRVYTNELDNEPTVMMVAWRKNGYFKDQKILETQNKETIRPVDDYFVPNVSENVLRIIIPYTDYVNRIVWGKY